MAGAVRAISARIEAGGALAQVVTVNPEFVMHARRDAGFRAVLAGAEMALADGVGVVWAMRRAGCRLAGPVPGVDLVSELALICAARGWRPYLLGAGPGVAAEAARRLEAAVPGLRVAGSAPGSPRVEDDAATSALVEASRADLLLVAYGHPRQEFWIARNRGRLRVPVAIGVGGAFDFLAGRVPRAPTAWRRAGLEWAYRLFREPWRARRMAALPGFAIRVVGRRHQCTAAENP